MTRQVERRNGPSLPNVIGLMQLLDRYLFRQFLEPTIMATLALSVVGILSQSLQALDIIVKQGQSALVMIQIVMLAMPQLLTVILPAAVYIAALTTLNRLLIEQEVVVCFASGVSRWRVIAPAMRLSVLAALIILVVNLWVAPFCERILREELFKIRTDLAATLVEPGQFTQPSPGLTVYAQDRGRDGTMRNLFVLKEKPDGSDTTFIAATGKLDKRNGVPVLTMRNGSSQEFSKVGVLNYLKFDEYAFDLSDFVSGKEVIRYKVPDRYLHELLFPNLTQRWEQDDRLKMLAEANARLATPLYAPALLGMALAAILGAPFSRLGYLRRILWFSGCSTAARVAGVGIQAYSDGHAWANILQYLIPLAVLAWAMSQIFRQPRARSLPLTPFGGQTLMPSAAA